MVNYSQYLKIVRGFLAVLFSIKYAILRASSMNAGVEVNEWLFVSHLLTRLLNLFSEREVNETEPASSTG